ncbi:MAG TPA: hypothetical protein DCY51_01715 [Bacteroidetes bacterium]|nr:hypothetical protein [Bacteroidota bacterium]
MNLLTLLQATPGMDAWDKSVELFGPTVGTLMFLAAAGIAVYLIFFRKKDISAAPAAIPAVMPGASNLDVSQSVDIGVLKSAEKQLRTEFDRLNKKLEDLEKKVGDHFVEFTAVKVEVQTLLTMWTTILNQLNEQETKES